MEFEPKTVPEGINTSTEHPLKEFIILAGGITLAIVIIISLLAMSADFLIKYIPVEQENEWFTGELLQGMHEAEAADRAALETKVEQYLLNLVQQLRRDEQQNYRFTVSLVEDKSPNAFVLPGGHIFVTSALLESVNSENGLAMVLAHEMGHQYHRHPLRSAGRGIVITLALLVISGTETGGMAQSFIDNTATLTNLSFSRDQEREADSVAIELLLKYYGHTSGSSEFFESIEQHPGSGPDVPVFMSTHPGIEERVKRLQDHATRFSGASTPLDEVISRYLESIEKQDEAW